MSSTDTDPPAAPPRHGASPVLAFIIGLSIILLASILNAAGLNLTKLDHVRTSAIPKAARRKDWMRPLWLLGMLLYILSQLIGSTLALEYMRAEYVAPLGSTSLVFNFLFARFLVGTPVTTTDIYGTIVVVLGVIGIVAFGSINSGLTSATDVAHITYLWRRAGWLSYFFSMSAALVLVLIFTYRLDWVLAQRAELAAVPFSAVRPPGAGAGLPAPIAAPGSIKRRHGSWLGRIYGVLLAIASAWDAMINWVTDRLEIWAAPKDDTQVAWTLGIGWACCGGGLAGGCLVFAKAIVKLLSGSLSRQNPGNQFGHASPIFTIILLVITAVLQIICLNRGLKVYDSTLVVPVFYGVYTATGWLDSLIFNDEVEAYKSWTLFLIFVSILILISGVVLLTHKKPEPVTGKVKSTALPKRRRKAKPNGKAKGNGHAGGPDATTSTGTNGRLDPADDEERGNGESEVLWAVGDASDDDAEYDYEESDDDVDHHLHPIHARSTLDSAQPLTRRLSSAGEQRGLVRDGENEEDDDDWVKHDNSSSGAVAKDEERRRRRRSMDPFRDEHELDDMSRTPR